ncbi:MAG: hypothetical protein ACRD3R_06450, partial [Terriglobales bacterium]
LGIRYAHDAGFDPDGAVRLFTLLAKASSSSPIPFLSTHPVSDERIANMAAIANDLKSAGSERSQDSAPGPDK